MSSADVRFRELADTDHVEEVALSHLSIELGHLHKVDYDGGLPVLTRRFRAVAPWVAAARTSVAAKRPRISTCFLVDDYFASFSSPAEVLPDVLAAAGEHGLTIDYIARESACAGAGGTPLAEIVAGRITPSPPPGTSGSRPPAMEIGWLSNGRRSPGTGPREAMNEPVWRPPEETEAGNHSVFVDVELWSEQDGARSWSCAYLAVVWQLLRLGVVRDAGANVVRPVPMSDGLPGDWADLPPIMQVNPAAAPFCAYRTTSIIPAHYLGIEHAVRVILGQYSASPAVIEQLAERSGHEGLDLPADLTERLGYVFFGEG